MQQLTILPDIEELLPPLSPEEYEGLKADMIANGCRDALVVWNDTIIDGHNRYSIALEHNIPFKTIETTFESINDAKLWIIQNQSSQRNLSAYSRTVLALQMKPFLEEKAKRRMLEGKKQDPPLNSAEGSGETREQIAKIAGIGKDTVSKVEFIEANANDETKEKLRRGEKGVSISGVYTKLKEGKSAIREVPSDEQSVVEPYVATSDNDESSPPPTPRWEPSVTLNKISCVDPNPLVGAIFELFPEEYRSKFFSAFFDRFLYWQGKDETEKMFIQLAQTLNNSKTKR